MMWFFDAGKPVRRVGLLIALCFGTLGLTGCDGTAGSEATADIEDFQDDQDIDPDTAEATGPEALDDRDGDPYIDAASVDLSVEA